MKQLTGETLEFLCRSLSNACGMPVRIFKGAECVAYHSVYQLQPDPVALQLPMLLDEAKEAGVIASPLMQYYGYFPLPGGERMMIGPSRAESSDVRLLREQVILLGVPQEEQTEYLRSLSCLPVYSMARMSWLVSLLCTVSRRKPVAVEDLFQNLHAEDHWEDVRRDYADIKSSPEQGMEDQELLDNGYRFEQMILTYVEQGEPRRARELLEAPPDMLAGQLSRDALRQAKDLCICAAAIASRAAIRGGLDSRTAFRMSDVYIQQAELLRDVASVNRLRSEIFVDFAGEVRRVRYHVRSDLTGEKGSLFVQCAEYVSENIFSPIRAQEMADALGYTRSYLCSRFRELSGMTLTQYIQQEKVFEAQRLLRFTDQSLSQLAALLAFSSQSHFQNVFKKLTGETPAQYRNRMR